MIYIKSVLNNKVAFVKTVSDCLPWLKLDASLFDLNDDVYIGLCYNPPEGSSREVYDDKSIFDSILEDMIYFDELSENGCNAFVWGDFNARTATRTDYVDNDSVLIADLLPDDYIIDQSLPRSSEDSICNEYGTCL